VVVSADDVAAIVQASGPTQAVRMVNPADLQLLAESARIRLAYADDRQCAAILAGIRMLPHQIEAICQRTLPQPRLWFLPADDPGAGKTIMARFLIKERLGRWGFTTCEIPSGMPPHERKRAQEAFSTYAQVCVEREIAGEGISLQSCHLMIGYDMPRNPTRLEQRLGRIRRIGRRDNCHVLKLTGFLMLIRGVGMHMDPTKSGKLFDRGVRNNANLQEMAGMFTIVHFPAKLRTFFEPLQEQFLWDHFHYFRLFVLLIAFAWGRRTVASPPICKTNCAA
jgi:hypothetical protein